MEARDGERRGPDLRARTRELRSSAAAKGEGLRSSAAQRGAELRRSIRSMDVPWARCRLARVTRETFLQCGLGPAMRCYTRLHVDGRDRFAALPAPVILAANHSSHLDTPTILRALPRTWRQRTAVAAAADYFYKKRWVANAVALAFNTVPIVRGHGAGADSGAFDHVDALIDHRWNLLIFPEGTRSREGRLGRLRPGAAVIAREHGIPIVPVSVRGTHEAMPPGQGWPRRIRTGALRSRRHRLEVRFGPPISVAPDGDVTQAMERVRRFFETGTTDLPHRADPRIDQHSGALA